MPEANQINDVQLLAQFSQIYRGAVDSFMDQVDSYRGQALLLCTIIKQDGMTQSEIAESLSVQGATITNMVKRMEESNLVIRRRDPEDNRLVRVYMTDKGRQLELSINEQLRKLEDTVFNGIRREERKVLRRLLLQMISNMSDES